MSRTEWGRATLGDVMTLDRDPVKVEPTGEYPNLGIYSFGRGVFSKPPIRGDATSAGTLYRVRGGQVIYSRLFAFEGAFAVVPAEMDGRYVSNEYPTFSVDTSHSLLEFVAAVVCRPAAWAELASMTVGMGHRRQRLKPEALLEYEFVLPPLTEQRRIVDSIRTLDQGLQAAKLLRERALIFLSAFRESRLVEAGAWRSSASWRHTQLEDVCEVALGFTKGRKLVGETTQLPYLRALNVQNGFIDLDEVGQIDASEADLVRYALQADDVLLLEGCGNPRLVGRGWIWDGSIAPCLHQNSTLRARVRDATEVLPRFVAYAIAASPARRHCYDSMEQMSVAHLGLAGARAIPLPVPPVGEQREVVRDLDRIRVLLVAAQRKIAQYERARRDVVEELLSGNRHPQATASSPTMLTA